MAHTAHAIGVSLLAVCLAFAPTLAAEKDRDLEGNVEITVRDVSQDGSVDRYNEDFDGLDSGVRLSHLDLDWLNLDTKFADYLRVEADGLGGDPYERTMVRFGRSNLYDLRLTYRSQDTIYDLSDLVGDLDRNSWDSRRQTIDTKFKFHATDAIELYVDYQRIERDGSSQVVEEINTELYTFDSPLDQSVDRVSVGGRFEIGRVDLHFRQMLRQYDYRFDTSTADNSGLTSGNFARLDMYNRLQDDRGETDLSTLTVSAPLGQRAHVSASVFGTFLGDETLTSDATFNAEGSASVGVCSISGTVCSGVMPCDTGIPGNICIPDAYSVTDGTNQADIEADFLVLDVDFSVQLKDGLDLHLQGRTLERDVQSTHVRDLDGNGVADDLEGTVQDTVAGSITSVDYSLDTLTALFDYRPSDRYRFRFGYRTINRELEREGFEFGTNDARNTPFESDSDGTVILGATLQPSDWFRLDANYEEGDITQAFTAVAPMETNRVRVRARFTPQPDLRIDVRYSGYENTNLGIDFRQADDCTTPGADIESGCWTGRAEGTTYSGRVWHRPSSALDYWFSWSQNDVDSAFRIRFDTEVFFNSAENGDSIYDSQSTELAAQVNINWSDQWKLFFRTSMNDASGHNRIAGVTFSNNIDIMQDYSDFEVGLTHTFDNGVYVGGRLRMFDYNDVNDRMDYDGDIFALTAGLRF